MSRDDLPLFTFSGERVHPDRSGALWLPDHETLVVSDLHFEKGSSFARRGVLLPPYDTRATLAAVGALMNRFQPRRVISLGDSFHDLGAEARMDEDDLCALRDLTRQTDWVWILGNHDPEPPASLGGRAAIRITVGGLHFQHEAAPIVQRGEVSGHFHPCARISAEGRHLRRRCFIHDGRRLILPSMGAFTGGLNVLDPTIRTLFGDKVTVWALGRDRVFPIDARHLRPDQQSLRA
ncbi:MAG: ligase-associated DNA damage response endonuclease PdeM [Pseudomonadota bacterium]